MSTAALDKHDQLAKMALTVNEAAAAIGVNRRTMSKLVQRGDIRGFKLGKRYFIQPREIQAWLDRGLEPATANTDER
jgi:excisionase family DNA binding protein